MTDTPPHTGTGENVAADFAESYRKVCKVTGMKYPHTLAQSVIALRYTQAQLDTAVQGAVETEREKYDWLCRHYDLIENIQEGGYVLDRGMTREWYPTVDALVSSEMPKDHD